MDDMVIGLGWRVLWRGVYRVCRCTINAVCRRIVHIKSALPVDDPHRLEAAAAIVRGTSDALRPDEIYRFDRHDRSRAQPRRKKDE